MGKHIMDLSRTPNKELYLLSDKQEAFLMSKTVNDDIFTGDYRYVFIRELFFPWDSNSPIDDSLFLLTIFETANLLLHLFNPSHLINIPSKHINIDNVNRLYKGGPKSNIKTFEVVYTLNPLQKKLIKRFIIFDGDMSKTLAYKINFNYKVKVGGFNRIYNIENFNDLLGNLFIIYDWFVDLMPNEFE